MEDVNILQKKKNWQIIVRVNLDIISEGAGSYKDILRVLQLVTVSYWKEGFSC